MVGRKSRGGHPPERGTSFREVQTSRRGGAEKLKDRTDLKDVALKSDGSGARWSRFGRQCVDCMSAGAPGSFEPVGSPRRTLNTSPTASLTRRGAPHLQMGRGCSATGNAADSGWESHASVNHRTQGTSRPLQSGGEGDTALSDGSLCDRYSRIRSRGGDCHSDHYC